MSESDVGDTKQAIMEATFHAFCEHGYAGTTISDIADEFDKSKSLLYYHYDDKEAIFEDFLEFLFEQIESEFGGLEADDPAERLQGVIDVLVPPEMDDKTFSFRRALQEARADAPHSETYRKRFEESDELMLSELERTVARGIEAGQFRPIDPELTAEFLYATAYGGMERAVTLDDRTPVERIREALEQYVDETLLVDD
jgi:AcrR family transcriptional regulator